jgi:DNA-binding MarR family transcriptional regulator
MSTVPARITKGRGDGFGLSLAEIARHVGVTTSGITQAVARLEEEG